VKGVPADYYRRLRELERRHWWSVGMREVSGALLRGRMHGALLDAGCGTGGFLAWAAERGSFGRLCGVDVSPEAIEVARAVVPGADLRVASVHELPFEDASFELVVLNDVLQHVHEDEIERSLHELRRVLVPSGALLVRTGGARRGLRERADWRSYDAGSLAAEIRRGGFAVERVTYVNMIPSLLGREPQPPTEISCGIPPPSGRLASRVGTTLLSLEALYLRRPGRSLPRGRSLLALAVPLP
jgi:SAM-dependent methyltransferase